MPTRRRLIRAMPAFLLALSGCAGGEGTPTPAPPATPTGRRSDLALRSPAFAPGEAIPEKHSCVGAGVSPPLAISNVPADAETFALVVDDPDAGDRPYVHWLVWNVPADRTEWPTDIPPGEEAGAVGGLQGTNSAGKLGYFPSCPPAADGAHAYRYSLRAVGEELDLEAGATRGELDRALEGAVVATATLRGTFDRG